MRNVSYKSKQIKIFNLLVGILTRKGNRAFAEKVLGQVLFRLLKSTNKSGMEVLEIVIERLKPLAVLKPRVVAGITYKIPILPNSKLQYGIAVKWLVEAAHNRSERELMLKLFNEIFDTWQGNSNSLRKRDELHKLVLANRPFLKFLSEKSTS